MMYLGIGIVFMMVEVLMEVFSKKTVERTAVETIISVIMMVVGWPVLVAIIVHSGIKHTRINK